MARAPLRYVVRLEPYSLDAGHVGASTRAPIEISEHRTLVAAGRVLGSLINGNRQGEAKAHAAKGEVLRYLVQDRTHGRTYPRKACGRYA